MRTLPSLIILTLLSFNLAASELPFSAAESRPLAIGPERQISGTQRSPYPSPAIAWNGSVYLVVWQQYSSQSDDYIVGRRFDSAGTPIDETPFPIARGSHPALASDGTDFMLVYTSNGLMALQVPADAGSIGQPSVVVRSSESDRQILRTPRIEFGADLYLVVWEQRHISDVQSDVRAVRLTHEGVPLEPGGIAITPVAGNQYEPAIVWSGHEFLVVWTNGMSQCDGAQCQYTEQIFGTMLDPSLAQFKTVEITQPTVMSKTSALVDAPIWSFQPEVGWNGKHFLVVWGGWPKDKPTTTQLYATRLSPAGDFPDGRPSDGGGMVIRGIVHLQRVSAIESLGGEFHVFWEEGLVVCQLASCPRPRGSYGNLFGVAVSEHGVLGSTYPVSTEDALEKDADVVLRPNGRGLIVYDSDSNVMMRVIGGPGRTRPVRPRGSARYP